MYRAGIVPDNPTAFPPSMEVITVGFYLQIHVVATIQLRDTAGTVPFL